MGQGPDRDACLYREYGYTPSAEPTRRAAGSTTPPVVIGIPVTTGVAEAQSSLRSGKSIMLSRVGTVTARFVDAWYAGGSGQACGTCGRPVDDPTLIDQLASTDREALPGSRRIGVSSGPRTHHSADACHE